MRQGAGMGELLKAFDKVGSEHEKMEAAKFNDDATFKALINQVDPGVRAVCGVSMG